MNTNKLIIFDCDGTLVDSEGLANQVFIDQVHELGIRLSQTEAWQHFPGTSLHKCMEYVEKKFLVRLPADFEPEYRQRSREAFAKELQPIEGITDILPKIDHEMCVASNGPGYIVEENLENTGLKPYFGKRVFSAHDIQRWKPLPDLFLHAASTLGYKPNQCVVIEDSAAGIEAGLEADMIVLAYVPNGHAVPAIGATVFSKMQDLPRLLLELL